MCQKIMRLAKKKELKRGAVSGISFVDFFYSCWEFFFSLANKLCSPTKVGVYNVIASFEEILSKIYFLISFYLSITFLVFSLC